MSDFKSKKAPNSILDGALPQTPLGELAALPIPPADPIPAPGLETTCLPKYVSLNPHMGASFFCFSLSVLKIRILQPGLIQAFYAHASLCSVLYLFCL